MMNAREWTFQARSKYWECYREFKAAEEKVALKPSDINDAHYTVAQRELSKAGIRMYVAESVSQIVEQTKEGRISLDIPELGLIEFEWSGN